MNRAWVFAASPDRSVPPDVARDMRVCHLLGGGLPQSYVDFHERLARTALAQLAREVGASVVGADLADDGCGDGMRVVEALLEPFGVPRRVLLRWHDANRGFVVRADGGWRQVRESDFPAPTPEEAVHAVAAVLRSLGESPAPDAVSAALARVRALVESSMGDPDARRGQGGES